MAERFIDYEQMMRDLMDVLEVQRSLPTSQRRRLDSADVEATPWRSVDQLRQFPGLGADRGEASSDVGFLDPVDMLAGTLSAPARAGVKALGRNLTQPGPSMRPMLRSQRGSTGGRALPADEDPAWRRQIEALRQMREDDRLLLEGAGEESLGRTQEELESLYQRVKAAMNRDLSLARGAEAPRRMPGEDLASWEKALRPYEQRYDLEDLTRRPWQEPEWPDPSAAPERPGRYLPPTRLEGKATDHPLRRTADLEVPRPTEPASRAQDYAEIIRKLFEQGGR